MLCSFLLVLLALCFIAFIEQSPCCAEDDVMKLLCQDIEQDDRYKDFVEDIKNAGFSVADVVNPGVYPVDSAFSKTIHNLLSRYINVMLDWEYYCKGKGHFTDDGTWHMDNSMWSSFQGYLNLADPLLQPSLAHLLHLALNNGRYVREKERGYLKLRMQAINKIFWPGGSQLMTDWESIYTGAYYLMLMWPSDLSFYFKADNTEELKENVKNYDEESFEGDHEARVKAVSFILNHIEARAYGVATGSEGSQRRRSHVSEDEIKLRTAWDAFCDLSQYGTASAGRDALRIPHFSFVYRYLRTGDKVETSRKLLGLAWLQQTFIERGGVRLRQNAKCFSKMKTYRLPEPLLRQGSMVGGSPVSTYSPVSASSPRSPLLIVTGAGITIGKGDQSPVLYIQPSPPVTSAGSAVSTTSKVMNSAHITRVDLEEPISVVTTFGRRKYSSNNLETFSRVGGYSSPLVEASLPSGSAANEGGLLMLTPVPLSKDNKPLKN